jgi:serine/threonine-protein kinase RsbW
LKIKHYSIQSKRSDISKLEKILESYHLEKSIGEEKYINFLIASSEAMLNAVVHGNKENPEKKVFIRIEDSENLFILSIKDEGEGFDINKIPDPTENSNIYKENGRGVFIIKSLVDEFICNTTKEGTEVILKIKKGT